MDKAKLLDLLRDRVNSALAALTESQSSVQEGAIHEENRQEHPKDTRAIEAAYLARGLAERVENLRDTVAALAATRVKNFGDDDPIALTALVTLEDDTLQETVYFLVPSGGGETMDHDGVTIHVITPRAPVGRALIGKYAGDEIHIELPSTVKRMTIAAVE